MVAREEPRQAPNSGVDRRQIGHESDRCGEPGIQQNGPACLKRDEENPLIGAAVQIRSFRSSDEPAVVAVWHECGLTRPWNDPHPG